MLTKIGALKTANPDAWARAVRAAMRAAGGRVPDAAKALAVGRRTLERWLNEPALASVERAPHGLPRNGRRGRPRTRSFAGER